MGKSLCFVASMLLCAPTIITRAQICPISTFFIEVAVWAEFVVGAPNACQATHRVLSMTSGAGGEGGATPRGPGGKVCHCAARCSDHCGCGPGYYSRHIIFSQVGLIIGGRCGMCVFAEIISQGCAHGPFHLICRSGVVVGAPPPNNAPVGKHEPTALLTATAGNLHLWAEAW